MCSDGGGKEINCFVLDLLAVGLLRMQNLNNGLLGDAWREPRENPGLAYEDVNTMFLLKRKKVGDNIGEQEQQQKEEEVNEKLKRDARNTHQKKDCSNNKMIANVIKKEEGEVNKKLKRDGSSRQKKGCSNKKTLTKTIKEEEEEEEVNKKLKRDGSSQQKKGCSNKKTTTKFINKEVATAHKPPRCKRSDGKNWRCSESPALPHTLCENHLHKSRFSYNKKGSAFKISFAEGIDRQFRSISVEGLVQLQTSSDKCVVVIVHQHRSSGIGK
jgi:hypothetical protein